MKHLTSEQLDLLTRQWADWQAAAPTETQRRSRARLRVVFLLIRYAALRLGEALALDDTQDLDFAPATVRVNGRNRRKLPIPCAAMAELTRLLEAPLLTGLRGNVTALDQGYVRRCFYARSESSGLPRDLLSPRVLRHSRGIELLRGKVPVAIVQRFLGQQSPMHAASCLSFSDEEAGRIVHDHLRREAMRRTSARNAFTGSVTRMERGPVLTAVELTTLSGLAVNAIITSESATNLDLREGSLLTATVKAPWVVLTAADTLTSAGNSFAGTVREVRRGAVEAEAIVELTDGTLLCALVPVRGSDELLTPGRPVFALINALAVILGVE